MQHQDRINTARTRSASQPIEDMTEGNHARIPPWRNTHSRQTRQAVLYKRAPAIATPENEEITSQRIVGRDGTFRLSVVSTDGCHCQKALEKELAAIRRRILTLEAELSESASDDDRIASASSIPMATSSFHTIPTELRLIILRGIPDVETLLNFILASRVDYNVYKRFEDTILPNVILNKLAYDSHLDLRKEADWVEFCVYPKRWSPYVNSILQSCYQQLHQGECLRLSRAPCRALLSVHEGRLWRSIGPSVDSPLEIVEPNDHFADISCVAEGKHRRQIHGWTLLHPYGPASLARNEYLESKYFQRKWRY